jgi:futalosine hydrolase
VKILLTTPSDIEANPIINLLKPFKYNEKENIKTFLYQNIFFDLLISGIGNIATTHSLSTYLAKKEHILAISFGIAGAINKKIKLSTVFNITQEQFSDDYAIMPDKTIITLHDYGLIADNVYSKTGVLLNNNQFPYPILNKLPQTTGSTINRLTGKFTNHYPTQPDIETMENAAFFYCCKKANIPFISIRAVSNYIDERDFNKWQITPALENLTQIINQLISEICKN